MSQLLIDIPLVLVGVLLLIQAIRQIPQKKLWLCGRLSRDGVCDDRWEFQGIFSTKKKAVQAAKDTRFFVYPVQLDEELPTMTIQPPGAWYPLLEDEPKS